MKETAAASPSPSRLNEALLDYFSAPGSYQLSLREPSLLFASVREILQIAAGRGAATEEGEKLRQAAVFFIRAALLFPGADHYAVLGYPARADAADAKERYRLLMRLTHPDFATPGAAAWPADAAVRVNRAYEVLSSPVLRREYDEQLASNRAPAPAPVASSSSARPGPPARRGESERSARKKVVAVIAALLAAAGIALLLPRSEPDQLVQRVAVASASRHQKTRAESAPAVAPAALESSERLSTSAPQEPVAAVMPAAPPPEAPRPRSAAAPLPVAPASPPVAVAQAPVPVPAPEPRLPATTPVSPPAPAHAATVRALPKPTQPTRAPEPREWREAVRPPERVAAAPSVQVPSAPAPSTLAVPRLPEATRPQPAIVAAIPLPPAQPAAVQPIPLAPPPAAATPVAIARTVATVAPIAPTLADAQPILTQLLHNMESAGNGEQLLRVLDTKARQAPGARGLSTQFDRMVQSGRPVRVSQVEFRGETRDGVLLVTGRMRIHAGEPTIGSYGQKFILRAEFTMSAGKILLTGLSGAAD